MILWLCFYTEPPLDLLCCWSFRSEASATQSALNLGSRHLVFLPALGPAFLVCDF